MKNSDQLSTRLVIQRVVLVAFAFLLLLILVNQNLRANFLSGSGIASGALIVAVAIGIVLTYRGSGVVNFSNGAIAMYAAYVFAVLRSQGDLFLPPLPNPLSLIEAPVNFSPQVLHSTYQISRQLLVLEILSVFSGTYDHVVFVFFLVLHCIFNL